MTYSYTQISQYLTCPRKYRHRYLDGWREKDTRAAMLFGRAFEQALGAYFRREDSTAALFRVAAGSRLPLEKAPLTIQLSECIDIGHEVSIARERSGVLDLKIATGLSDADTIVLSKAL